MANAGEQAHLVLFEPHAGTSAVAEPAAGKLGADVLDGDAQACRQALDDHDERLAV